MRTPEPTTGPRSTATACSGRPTRSGSSSQKTIAVAHGFVLCATDEIGFSSEDIPNTIGILNNLGRFPELTDRVQQGLLNELLLGRLMTRPTGFVTDARFHVDDGDINSPSTIDASNLYYQGISQGGILGGALTAISPDFTRAYLGVPAMNYSVLLPRSIDFDEYELVLDPSLSRPDDEAAVAVADPDALGSLRAQRLCAPHDRQPAAEHAAA